MLLHLPPAAFSFLLDSKMAEKSSEKQDAAAECGDPDGSYMYTDDDIRSNSDADWESCSSDSSLSDEILIHLLRRAHIFYQGRRVKTKRDANETLLIGVSKECAAKNAMELVQEEEREKQRVEKRKARNKRKKEKKKEKQLELNKNSNKDSNREDDSNKNNVSEDDNVTKQKKGHLNGYLSKEKKKESKEEVLSESDTAEEDDFLDLNSAFVTNVANKNKQKSVNKTHRKKTVNVDAAIDEGEKLALQGYIAARSQQYEEAVNHFTKAINFIKTDYRFYNNRSFCYCQLGQYMKGLKDADKAIECSPNHPKGYFRRGEALRHLKQYKEAEEAFLKALELDDNIVEARQELNNLKVQQLLDMGFKLHEAQTALQQHCTVQAAVEALSINKDESLEDEDEIFYSDDEEQSSAVAAKEKIDLSNPLGLTSLWVGNITESITEFQLVEVFSRYGEIASIKLLPHSFCAFINYKDKSAPGLAMRCLQGIFMGGQNLIIRFPNKAAADTQQKALLAASTNHLKVKGPVNSNECHYWRTTGCAFGDKCCYVHIQEHKGIDRKRFGIRRLEQ